MNIHDMHIIESLKKIKAKDLVYSGIMVLFIIIVIILFFMSTRFISQNINKVFSNEGGESVQALDLAHYTLVAKKLGITVNNPSEKIEAPPSVNTPHEIPSPTTVPILNKKALTIMVRNSTAKAGAASALAKTIENAGFSVPKTSNEKTSTAVTTIFIKESKRDYVPSLLSEVSKTYSGALVATASESAPFDATIIIGEK